MYVFLGRLFLDDTNSLTGFSFNQSYVIFPG